MQSKIFTAAVAALSLSTVQCASVPKRQVAISPGFIVTPGVLINPDTLGPTQAIFQTINLIRADIGTTVNLANQISNNTAGNVLGSVSQAVNIAGAVTGNVATIVGKVNQLVGLITPLIPNAPAVPNLPDIGGASQQLVLAIQDLTKAITAQLDAVRAQGVGLASALVLPTVATLQIALQTALNALGNVSAITLNLAATAVGSVQAVLDKISKAKAKLDTVVVIGAQPSIEF
ncbi:hypothetical protein LZ32DRAFT_645740 [Colletotrichum eremochloae]|nr:hypothetical protein LZ32DRAFT_645740 [Colletotrichum eremochloae]